jgi:thiamine-phosphate pyrophosphorylase
MLQEPSPAVQRAIDAAALLAREAGHEDVGAVHLLRGLLAEEEGRPVNLIGKHGCNVENLCKRLSQVRVSFGSSVAEILRSAQYLSRHQNNGTITSEFFLLALLRDDDLRSSALQQGLNVAALEEAILGPAPPTIEMGEPIELMEPPEQIATGRILDANANRAREALRVLEDYARLALEDAFLTRELKSLRHELASVLDKLPGSLLLGGRETLTDVGTDATTELEYRRRSSNHVAVANSKRLQEAIRTLEEFSKILDPHIGRELEKIRYRTYTLERAMRLSCESHDKLAQVRLYVLLTGTQCVAAMDWTIQQAAAGGAGMFQLRENNLGDRELLEKARNFRRWTRDVGALFILNDRPDIARLAEADGVHLGQNDLSVKDARILMGPNAIIGVSTHDVAQVQQAVLDGATYIGVGPTFPSLTKEFEKLAGLEFVKSALAETSLPAFVIGGINQGTVKMAVEAGAERIAVSAAISTADDPYLVARTLKEALKPLR